LLDSLLQERASYTETINVIQIKKVIDNLKKSYPNITFN